MTATTPLSSELEIQSAYQGSDMAEAYVGNRFESELNRLLHERQVAAVHEVMTSQRPESTLEIAPGPGRVTRDIRPAGQLTCLEFNEGMIEEGRSNCPDSVEWVHGNAFELPFDVTFGFVYSFRFIRHFKSEDRQRLYFEIHQVLDPGGWFVFDAVNAAQSRPLREANPEAYPVYDKLYDRTELVRELNSAGFTDIRLQTVQKFYAMQLKSQILIGPRSKWINRCVIRSLETLPRRDGLEWVVICRRA